MESVNRRTGLLICIVLAILSVVIFAGIFFAIVEKRGSSGKRTVAAESSTVNPAGDSVTKPVEVDRPNGKEAEITMDPNEVSLNPGDLLPMKRSENPHVEGSVEISYGVKEESA